MTINRRKFIKNTGAIALLTPFYSMSSNLFGNLQINDPLRIHLFSKHLQFLDVMEAAQISKEIGFDGLDLTVRSKGHILPENVIRDLPSALREIRETGIKCEMITTAISDATNAVDINVIKTAAANGIKYYRSNWFEYLEDRTLEESLSHYQEVISQLSQVNKSHNIIGCYQNHSGIKVGATTWEVKKILENANQEFFGTQYDIRHAVAEGGRSWPNGLKLIKDNIKTIVLKDFKWGKVDGKWEIVNVPIGEGMVDFTTYFKLLKSYGLNPPVSLHLEYPLGGAEKGKYEITIDKTLVYEAMKKDLNTIQKLWKEA